METRKQTAAKRGADARKDHVDLDDLEEAPHAPEGHGDPEPRAPATAVSATEMMDLCTRMMLQTQQVLQKMARDKEDEKAQWRRDDEFRWEQSRARLEMEERLENDQLEDRRLAREAQGHLEALRAEETRAMRDAQERLEQQRLAEAQLIERLRRRRRG